MSRQLAISAAFSTLALTALALFAPGSARLSDIGAMDLSNEKGAASQFATPHISELVPEWLNLPLID